MTAFVLAIIAGFAVLLWGAERFVIGAGATARNLGVSPLIIGLTVVGFGTSAPEVLVSGVAAWHANPGLAVGNALGSNITNIGLVLGLTAVVQPLEIHSSLLRREFPVLMGIMALAFFLILDGTLSRFDGGVLLAGLVLLIGWMVRQGLQTRICSPAEGADPSCDPIGAEFAEEIPADMSTPAALGWFVFGLVLLLLSSRVLVWGAVGIAQGLGVSDLVIGLTVVAFGTSLPEFAASLAGALKNEHDIAVGNVIGSNMYNLLAVMGLPGLIYPAPCERGLILRDFPVMALLTLALYLMAGSRQGGGQIGRLKGAFLFVAFVVYEVVLYLRPSAM